MTIRTTEIQHPRFGRYTQKIGDMHEVGYRELPRSAGGRCGWNMPDDHATEELAANFYGARRILEIGPGDGLSTTLLALAMPGLTVTVLDIYPQILEAIAQRASSDGSLDRLTTIQKPASWWYDQRHIDDVRHQVGAVDLVIARQVLQFGSVGSLINVLRLTEQILTPGGSIWMENMSPYLGYIHGLRHTLDNVPALPGALLGAILYLNEEFADDPYTRSSGSELAFEFIPFLRNLDFERFIWFDHNLLSGALLLAESSLIPKDEFYFSPERIWAENKLWNGPDTPWVGPPEWPEQELHVARLTKEAD